MTPPGSNHSIWAVVLGWNHADDTVACLLSLATGRDDVLKLLYVDNGSEPAQVQRIRTQVPGVAIIRHPQNVGVARGFNAGLGYALQHGADYIFMANNDTTVEPDCIQSLLAVAAQDESIGLVQPKIFYDQHRDCIWSAGSRFRWFPPAIVMRQTPGTDDGRYDRDLNLEFSSFCTALVSGQALKVAGLLDPTYHYSFEDYDLSLRIRLAGYQLRLAPCAKSWHKVQRVTHAGTRPPACWVNAGRSQAIFSRKFRQFPWLTGPLAQSYVALRAWYEGGRQGFTHFLRGLAEGRRTPLPPVPRWNQGPVDPVEVLCPGT